MKKMKTRNIIIIAISIIAIMALAMAEYIENKTLTNGFFDMLLLLSGCIIIPTIMEMVKKKRDINDNTCKNAY